MKVCSQHICLTLQLYTLTLQSYTLGYLDLAASYPWPECLGPLGFGSEEDRQESPLADNSVDSYLDIPPTGGLHTQHA